MGGKLHPLNKYLWNQWVVAIMDVKLGWSSRAISLIAGVESSSKQNISAGETLESSMEY